MDKKVDTKAMVKALRKRRETMEMPGMDLRTGAPPDAMMGEKQDADLPDEQLPVYRGSGRPKPTIARR